MVLLNGLVISCLSSPGKMKRSETAFVSLTGLTTFVPIKESRMLKRVFARITHGQRVLLIAIFLVAFLVRVGYIALFVGFDSPPTYDGISYDIFAVQLARGEGYHTEYGPTAHKPPLYPLLLSDRRLMSSNGRSSTIASGSASTPHFGHLTSHSDC